jgi:hypothetical protein
MKKRYIIAVFSALACFALLPIAQAAPALETPDPGAVGGSLNTADGANALAAVTTGFADSAFGWFALRSNIDGTFNTAVGAGTLVLNVGDQAASDGIENTAVGTAALLFNTTGSDNTAVGAGALVNNANGNENIAVGAFALNSHTTRSFNNAVGAFALVNDLDGAQNNAMGDDAMFSNQHGFFNTAIGDDALFNCVNGDSNVAIGDEAGTNVIGGDGNIYIGAGAAGPGDEDLFIRIGDTSLTYDCFIAGIFGRNVDAISANPVFVDADGKLGTNLVDANGNKVPFQPQAMLNESLKQQKRIAELEGTVARLAAMVKEQAAQIQKVSAQLEVGKPATKVALGNQ